MKRSFGCLLLTLGFVAPLLAQDTPNYRLSFRITESATGQDPSSKNYVLLVQSKTKAKVNASLRLPHYSSARGDANELHTVALGNSIECIPEERQSAVRLDCAFESSFVAPSQPQKPIPIDFFRRSILANPVQRHWCRSEKKSN